RNGGMDGARDHAVALELAQRGRQHLLRYAAGLATQLIEAGRPAAENLHDKNRPLIADGRQNLADGAAVGRADMNGFAGVTECQQSASLRVRAAVSYVASVSNGYHIVQKDSKQMAKPKIAIVVGSTRQGRFADNPANWIY